MVGENYVALSEVLDDDTRPWLDRQDLDESQLTELQRSWRERGIAVLPGLIPDELIDRYAARLAAYHDLGGFATPTPYEHSPEIRAISLYDPLRAVIDDLIGDQMILHLNLTGWISTQRAWHQDDYLNGPHVNGWYLAVWIALEDINVECGPFEFIPGSHRWPVLRQDRVVALMTADEAVSDAASPQSLWTAYTQDAVARAVEERRTAENLPVESFLGRRGDALIWHACLHHRGSVPMVRPQDRWRPWRAKFPPRKALISHYTAISHLEVGAAPIVQDENGGRYVRHGLSLDHLHGPHGPTVAQRLKKRVEWVARRR